MTNLGEIKADVLVKLAVSTTTAYYTDDILNDWIDQAHKWAAGYKKWPFTEGRVSTTWASLTTDEDGMIVGEYPEGWKSDSIRYLTIGGCRVDKKNYYKFRQYLEDNSSATDRIFTDHGRRYYVNPRIDVSGTVTAWGQFTPAELDGSVPTSETVFQGEPEGAEAIVEKVLSFAKIRENKFQEAAGHENLAKQKLEELSQRIKDEQAGYQDTDNDGMFKRFDVVEGGFHDDLFDSNQF